MVPHAVMLQSLSTELRLSPHPGAPELLTQTWQTLDESRLFLKVLQPHSLCVIGMPSENEDTSQFLPTAPRIPPSPHRSESGVRGKRTGVGLAGSPTEPGGAGASPARELLLFTPRQADERPPLPRRPAPARVNYSDYFKESNRLPAALGKIFVSRLALSKGRKEVPGHAAGGERASAVRRAKVRGRLGAGEEGAPGTAALFWQCH